MIIDDFIKEITNENKTYNNDFHIGEMLLCYEEYANAHNAVIGAMQGYYEVISNDIGVFSRDLSLLPKDAHPKLRYALMCLRDSLIDIVNAPQGVDEILVYFDNYSSMSPSVGILKAKLHKYTEDCLAFECNKFRAVISVIDGMVQYIDGGKISA